MKTCRLDFFLQLKADRVYAVALAAFVRRAVIKDMSQMGAAFSADHFHAAYPQRLILPQFDVLPVRRFGETRPAGARIELRIGRKKLRAADGASEHPPLVAIVVLSGERRFGAAFAGNMAQFRGKLAVLFDAGPGIFVVHKIMVIG